MAIVTQFLSPNILIFTMGFMGGSVFMLIATFLAAIAMQLGSNLSFDSPSMSPEMEMVLGAIGGFMVVGLSVAFAMRGM
jgi:hypothetical protein